MSSRSSDVAPRLRSVLEPIVAESSLLLEDVTASSAGRRSVVRVVVDLPDGPGGVDSELLADVSRAISAALDDVDVLPGAYTLEVSTPGTDRPLSEPRHFRRATGRLVALQTSGGARHGRVTGVDDDGVWLEREGSREHISFAGITGGTVEPELRRLTGDEPLDDDEG